MERRRFFVFASSRLGSSCRASSWSRCRTRSPSSRAFPTPRPIAASRAFEEQWLGPACAATGYELVGLKIEEGSFFLYMYGAADPNEVIARLAPFDAALGFYDDQDPSWGEYATLKDLLDQAKAMPIDTALPATAEPTTQRSRGDTIGPATRAAVRAAAKAAVRKPATTKAAPAKRTSKLKKAASAKPAKKSATSAARKSPAKKTAAKKTAAKTTAAKTSAAKTSAAKTLRRRRRPRRRSAAERRLYASAQFSPTPMSTTSGTLSL